MINPGVAIVILNWNGKSFLEQFLPSVIEHSPARARVVIADNASSDDSIDFLEEHYPELQLIRLKENLGYAGGYNAALGQVEADYFVLLNSDIEVPPHWVEPVIEYLEANPRVAAAQPDILSWHEKQRYEYAGAAGGFIDILAYPFCRGRIFQHLEEARGQYAEPMEVFWATGACLFVRADAFRKAGGFDHRFFAHMEEVDLCWRLQNLGYKIAAIPASRVYHVGGGTLPKSSPLKTFLNFRNSLWLLTKNMPTRYFYSILPIRLGLDVMAALSFLAGGKWADACAVCRAHFAFFRSIRKIRDHAASLPKNLPSGMYKGSIAFTHFIRRKKTFLTINHKRMS